MQNVSYEVNFESHPTWECPYVIRVETDNKKVFNELKNYISDIVDNFNNNPEEAETACGTKDISNGC